MPPRSAAFSGDALVKAIQSYMDSMEAQYEQTFLALIESLSSNPQLKEVLRLIRDGEAISITPELLQNIDNIEIDTTTLRNLSRQAMAGGGRVTAKAVGLEGSFDITNPRAIEYARTMSSELIDAKQSVRANIREIIGDAIEEGMSNAQTIQRIKAEVGLTPRDAAAVRNLRARLRASGKTVAQANKEAAKYAERLLRSRAKTIARTEIARSVSAGQSEFWKQMQDNGRIPPNAKRIWITYQDEKLCEICGDLDGELAPIDGPWQTAFGSYDIPNAHPNCRCTSGLVFTSKLKKIDPTAYEMWLLEKGDYVGHPFRGNQWVGGLTHASAAKMFRAWGKDPVVRSVIDRYSMRGMRINYELRLGNKTPDTKFAVEIDRVLDSAPKFDDTVVVYRGIGREAKANKWKEGSVITDKGFSSASIDRSVAENFGSALLVLKVPPGTRAAYIGHISNSPDEREFLLGSGTSYKVYKVSQDKKSGATVVYAEVVRQSPIKKGDYPGHPFRGNQWTKGRGRGRAATEAEMLEEGGSLRASTRRSPEGDSLRQAAVDLYQRDERLVASISEFATKDAAMKEQGIKAIADSLANDPEMLGYAQSIRRTMNDAPDPKEVSDAFHEAVKGATTTVSMDDVVFDQARGLFPKETDSLEVVVDSSYTGADGSAFVTVVATPKANGVPIPGQELRTTFQSGTVGRVRPTRSPAESFEGENALRGSLEPFVDVAVENVAANTTYKGQSFNSALSNRDGVFELNVRPSASSPELDAALAKVPVNRRGFYELSKQSLSGLTDSELSLVLSYHTSQTVCDEWAKSSSSELSQRTMAAVHRQFGPDTVSPAGMEQGGRTTNFRIDDAALDVAVRHIYSENQKALAAAGISEVYLYRGTEQTFDLGVINAQAGYIRTLSSWSADPSMARDFAKYADRGSVFQMIVPAERIFSATTLLGGFGCWSESEFVVIGSATGDQVRVFTTSLDDKTLVTKKVVLL